MKHFVNLLIALVVLQTFMSCNDFLDEQPKTQLTDEQVYTNLKVLEPAIDGLYVSYRSAKAGRAGFALFLLGLDESYQGIVQMIDPGQAGLDYYDGNLNSTSSQINEMWARRWPSVNMAAKCIKGLEMMIEAETDSAQTVHLQALRANACFMRAMSMFEAVMYWGEVPVVEITDLKKPEVDMSRRPLSEVWKQIVSDFTYASEHLEAEYRQTGPRASRGSAYAMLMKCYMYAQPESGYRDFNNAVQVFEQKLKGNYSMMKTYATLFDEMWPDQNEFNLSESVFEIDFICNSSGMSHWQWDMGSRTLATLGEGEGCYIGGYDVVLPTEYCYSLKANGGLWEEGDVRRAASIRYDFTYYGTAIESDKNVMIDLNNDGKIDNTAVTTTLRFLELGTAPTDSAGRINVVWAADELDPHVKKWEDRRLDKHEPAYDETKKVARDEEVTSGSSMYYSGKNYLMIRYADLLLLYAEALNELNNTSEAITVVNQVRQRAFRGYGGTYQWAGLTKEQFRDEILDERMRELCFEGWRRMDLIRTGKFRELILARNKWTAQKRAIQDFHQRWPIPDSELRTNPNMDVNTDQNQGY